MRFTNENGEVMNLADNLTLHELLDMGVSISVSEETDPDQQIWLAEAGSGQLSHHSASSPPLSGGLFCGCFSPLRNDPLAIPRLPSLLSHGRCGKSLNVNSRLKCMTVLVR